MFAAALIWLLRWLSWPWSAKGCEGAWCRPHGKTTPSGVVAGFGIVTAGGWTL